MGQGSGKDQHEEEAQIIGEECQTSRLAPSRKKDHFTDHARLRSFTGQGTYCGLHRLPR